MCWPSAVLIIILGAVWRLGKSAMKTWREMLLGAAVVTRLALATLNDWQAWSIAILSALAVFRFRLHSAWLILSAAVLGYLLRLV